MRACIQHEFGSTLHTSLYTLQYLLSYTKNEILFQILLVKQPHPRAGFLSKFRWSLQSRYCTLLLHVINDFIIPEEDMMGCTHHRRNPLTLNLVRIEQCNMSCGIPLIPSSRHDVTFPIKTSPICGRNTTNWLLVFNYHGFVIYLA